MKSFNLTEWALEHRAVVLFLLLIVSVLAIFIVGEPAQTLLGAAVAAAGVPISFVVLPRGGRQS